jgi:uncharacterized integral membrane protein (TIGR00697 family)
MFQQLTEKSLKKILIALAIYITSLVAANTLGIKLIPFLFHSHLTAAILTFPVVFLMTDVIGEVYGKKVARFFVLTGFISTALFIGYTFLSLWMPWSVDGLWAREGYNTIFGLSLRFAIASLVAYAVGEYQDVFTFFFFRQQWGDKHFWIRSNLSNLWSQLLDSVLFNLIAFLGVYPIRTLVSITITLWLSKVLIGFLYTPLSYLGIKLLREHEQV